MKKFVKILLTPVVLFFIAFISAPLWGGCDFSQHVCEQWCQLRHYDNDIKLVRCKAGCAVDKLSCITK